MILVFCFDNENWFPYPAEFQTIKLLVETWLLRKILDRSWTLLGFLDFSEQDVPTDIR